MGVIGRVTRADLRRRAAAMVSEGGLELLRPHQHLRTSGGISRSGGPPLGSRPARSMHLGTSEYTPGGITRGITGAE